MRQKIGKRETLQHKRFNRRRLLTFAFGIVSFFAAAFGFYGCKGNSVLTAYAGAYQSNAAYVPLPEEENKATPSAPIREPGAPGSTVAPKQTNSDEAPVFAGGEVRFLADESGDRQQLSALLKSADGKLIVVDGGVAGDALHLLRAIKELGGTVDAWLITHPQADHAGALLEILEHHKDEIQIQNIYYHFLDFNWYEKVDPAECGLVWRLNEEFSKLPQEKQHPNMRRGDEVKLSDALSFRVLNDPYIYEDAYAVNNSSLMYDVNLAGKHIIFLGDMGPKAGDALLAEGVFDGLTADFVQMAHHGQNGVSEAVYRKLAPKACIWPTPNWLYQALPDNISGFDTYQTRRWVKQLGITENYCTKDGDVVLH